MRAVIAWLTLTLLPATSLSAQTTIFTTEDYRKDVNRWTDPAYYLFNTARELTDMQVDNRFGQKGSGADKYDIKSPYAFKTAGEHYGAWLKKAGGGTRHTLATLPNWDGIWNAGRGWLDSNDIQASTVAAALTPQYREYYVQQVNSSETGDPMFHGGDVAVTWLFTGETRSYNTVGGYFRAVSPTRTVFEGGPGALEGVLRFSYTDLDSEGVEGGIFWRITPMLNWHLSDHVRLELVYGYGSLDRFDVVETANIPFAHVLPLAWRCALADKPLVITWHEVWGRHWREFLRSALWPAFAAVELLAAQAGAPVVPVYVSGSARALPWGAGWPRPTPLTVAYGPPLIFARERGKTRYQAISDEIMAAIGRLQGDIEGRARAGRAGLRHDTDPTVARTVSADRIH